MAAGIIAIPLMVFPIMAIVLIIEKIIYWMWLSRQHKRLLEESYPYNAQY